MPLPKIKFSKSSTDLLSVDLLIGKLVFGHYELYLWDQKGTTQTLLGEGVNNDDQPDNVALTKPPQAYDGCTVQWRLDAAPLPSGDTTFEAVVRVRQGKDALAEGTFSWGGDLGDGKEIVGAAVLVAAEVGQ